MGICRDVSGHVGVSTFIQGSIIEQLCDDLGIRSLFLEESRAKRDIEHAMGSGFIYLAIATAGRKPVRIGFGGIFCYHYKRILRPASPKP